jgi:hypothetical protein
VGPPGLSEYLWPPDPALLPNELGYYVLFLVYQFPTISLALGFLGTLTLLGTQRSVATLLLGIVVVNGGTFVAHTVWPSATSAKYVFYIPDYVVFSLLCAIGTDRAMRQVAGRQPGGPLAFGLAAFALAAILPPLLYAAAPSTVKALGLDLVRASELPYRDSNRFFLNPSKRGDDGARRFGREALDTVKPRAVIFADYTPYTVLSYLQIVEGRRPDVLLQSAPSFGQAVPVRWVIDDGHRRPTYVATLTPGYYDLHGLGDHEFVPAGPIFEVHPR